MLVTIKKGSWSLLRLKMDGGGSGKRSVYLPNLPRGYNHFHIHHNSSSNSHPTSGGSPAAVQPQQTTKRSSDGVISEADGLKDVVNVNRSAHSRNFRIFTLNSSGPQTGPMLNRRVRNIMDGHFLRLAKVVQQTSYFPA